MAVMTWVQEKYDIRVGPKIVDVADRLVPRPGEDVYDAAGCTVLPGLHDHHLHIRAAAAAMTSVHVGPEVVRNLDDLLLAKCSMKAKLTPLRPRCMKTVRSEELGMVR